MQYQRFFYAVGIIIVCSFQTLKPMQQASLTTEKITPEVMQAAKMGDADSQYLMGQFHEHGLHVEGFQSKIPGRDRLEAVYWYKRAALQGHVMSLYRLGKKHLPEKMHDALDFFTKAAAQDHILSLYELALIHKKNPEKSAQEKAFVFFKKVVENSALLQFASLEKNYKEMIIKNQSRAAYQLARFYEKGLPGLAPQSFNDAAAYYKISIAKDQYDRALYGLALLLDTQKIVATESEDAKKCLLKAKNKKLPEASCLLAKMLVREEDKISNEAFGLYKDAADEGDEEALLQLASFYETGTCCQQSMEKAFECYKKAAALGNREALDLFKVKAESDPDSCCFLARLYLAGKKIPKDESQAILWARQGVKKGSEEARAILLQIGQKNPEALFVLANAYEVGEAGEKNLDLALEYLEKAARQLHRKALTRIDELARNKNQKASMLLAKFFHEGLPGVQKDILVAIDLYKKAVEQGSGQAAYILGNLFLEGKEVSYNEVLSLYYFGQAVTKNHPEAFNAIKEIAKKSPQAAACIMGKFYEKGIYVEKDLTEAENWYRLASRQNYAPAFCDLGRLAEQKRPLLIDSANSAIDCYLNASYWYERAKDLLGKELVRSSIKRISTLLSSLQALTQPDFNHELFTKIKPTLPSETSPYLLYHIAYLINLTATVCPENMQKIIVQSLIDLTKQESILTYSVMNCLEEIMQKAVTTGSLDNKRVFNLCHGILLMQPINANHRSASGLKFDKLYTGDPLIAVYNCLFVQSQSIMKPDEALTCILDLFDEQVQVKSLTAESLQAYAVDLNKEDYAHLRELFTKFLLAQKKYLAPVALTLLQLKPELQTQHIAYLVKLSVEAQRQGADLYIRYFIHPLFLDSQNMPLAVRVALVLARLREEIFASFAAGENGKLKNLLLYQKAAQSLELIGDQMQTSESVSNDIKDSKELNENESENMYLQMLDYFNKKYDLKTMVDYIKQEIDASKESSIPKEMFNAFMMQALNLNNSGSLYDESGRITRKSVEQLLTLLEYCVPVTT